MPRPKKEGAPEPKRRSRNGCWPCKARKVKCGEEKPRCLNCERQGEPCDYSIRLNWGGRSKKKPDDETTPSSVGSPADSPHSSTFSQVEFGKQTPAQFSYSHYVAPPSLPPPQVNTSAPDSASLDPELVRISQAHSQPTTFAVSHSPDGGIAHATSIAQSEACRSATSAPIDPRLHGVQLRPGGFDHATPSVSSTDGHVFHSTSRLNAQSGSEKSNSPGPMLPPFNRLPGLDAPSYHDPSFSPGHRNKRARLSPVRDSPSPGMFNDKPHGAPNSMDAYSPHPGPLTPYSPFATTPLTPGSSVASDDNVTRQPRSTPAPYQPPANLHRLSVSSLLSDPPVMEARQDSFSSEAHPRQYPIVNAREGYTTYGYDLGEPDKDAPKNDDHSAIKIFSPPMPYSGRYEEFFNGFGDGGRARDIAFEKGGYYEKPVPIKISKALEPLPPRLLENPMNLLYFHHFLNHTARILMPHDCDQNPFRKILPQMAISDDNILSLLLTYSASHRARLLSHPEPTARIAHWMSDVFPQLRQAVTSGPSSITDANLTAAIMLASLEIIAPNTFGVPISWQSHLTMARQMIVARGGPQTIQRSDKVAYFLSRWFAYLDVLGSLSGSKNDRPLSSNYWVSDEPDGDEEYQIDCLLGFTSRCVGILARIAELAKQCEAERIVLPDQSNPSASSYVRPGWQPSPEIVAAAESLREELQDSRVHLPSSRPCSHRPSLTSTEYPKTESQISWDSMEILATNEAFHWAGLVHVLRRVLGKPREDPEVQAAVREIVGSLYKVRRGSTAEACLLFPMFTAGCEALADGEGGRGEREKILERLRTVEGFGMIQVSKARKVMQKVWETGKPWETLVSGEFFG